MIHRISNHFVVFYSLLFLGVESSVGSVTSSSGRLETPVVITDDPATFVPNFELSSSALTALSKGKAWINKRHGWLVQDIQAPTATVWDQILDYKEYKHKVPDTLESTVYGSEKATDGSSTIFTHFQAGNRMFKLNFFVKARHEPFNNRLFWTLDTSRPNDIVNSVGCWYVLPINDETSRIYYKQEISLFPCIPGFIRRLINESAASGAANWVKRHSEGLTS